MPRTASVPGSSSPTASRRADDGDPSVERALQAAGSRVRLDAKGRRRLPVNDAAHVRNALARFNQVVFADEAARDKARMRLLNSARRHGIVPVGFIAGQLRLGRRGPLPTGQLALLFADIEGSSALLQALGEAYPTLLGNVRGVLRSCAGRLGGHEVDAYGDEFFAVFRHAEDALAAAIDIHRGLRDGTWPRNASVRMRVGIHVGRPTLTEHGYVGLAIHGAARIMAAAHGSQILLSEATARAIGDSLPPGIDLRPMGVHHLRGLANEALYQVVVPDLPADFPPIRATPVG